MKFRFLLFALGLFSIYSSGCAHKVAVPPAIDLKGHEIIGLISFECNEKGKLDKYATQKFLEAITKDQKSVRIIELGTQDDVLQSVGQNALGPEAIKSIAQKYSVQSVISGELHVDDVKPKIDIAAFFTTMTVEADVSATLAAKMVEGTSGATIWTGSARDKERVAHVSVFSGGAIFFDADNPDEAYGDLVEELIEDITVDFRITYQRKRD